MTIEVRTHATDRKPCMIIRAPQHQRGWQWVRYRGERYQVFGGLRGPYFIDLSNPVKAGR